MHMLVCVLLSSHLYRLFFFNDTASTEIYTLSLHDALPISSQLGGPGVFAGSGGTIRPGFRRCASSPGADPQDRKSTRLNSSHVSISYAVFCLKKKKKN